MMSPSEVVAHLNKKYPLTASHAEKRCQIDTWKGSVALNFGQGRIITLSTNEYNGLLAEIKRIQNTTDNEVEKV